MVPDINLPVDVRNDVLPNLGLGQGLSQNVDPNHLKVDIMYDLGLDLGLDPSRVGAMHVVYPEDANAAHPRAGAAVDHPHVGVVAYPEDANAGHPRAGAEAAGYHPLVGNQRSLAEDAKKK